MTSALRVTLSMLGLTAAAIALSIFFFGAEPTIRFGEVSFNALSGSDTPLSPAWPSAMDNELRFYAALFLAFGLLCLRAARDPIGRYNEVVWLACVFFLAGIGRALSVAAMGAPHPFLLTLMWLELLMPPIILILGWRARVAVEN